MTTKKYQIKDKEGNIYHPESEASIIKYKDGTVEDTLDKIDTDVLGKFSVDEKGNPLFNDKQIVAESNFSYTEDDVNEIINKLGGNE